MKRALVLITLVSACVTPQPPGGQFYCADDSDCPDGFTCEADLHCYDRVPECFILGEQPGLSTGCPPGEGCYWGTSEYGPVCQQPGLIGGYGTGCDLFEINSPLDRRCAPGHVCVPPGAFFDDNTCLRVCDVDDPCFPGDACILSIQLSEENRWWLGNEIRFCFPLSI